MDNSDVVFFSKVNDEMVKSWTALQLLRNVHHQLLHASHTGSGLAKLLADGVGSESAENQKKLFEMVQQRLERIQAVDRWIMIWIAAHKDES